MNLYMIYYIIVKHHKYNLLEYLMKQNDYVLYIIIKYVFSIDNILRIHIYKIMLAYHKTR